MEWFYLEITYWDVFLYYGPKLALLVASLLITYLLIRRAVRHQKRKKQKTTRVKIWIKPKG